VFVSSCERKLFVLINFQIKIEDSQQGSSGVSKFLLVEWENENKFNIVTRNSFVNAAEKTKLDEELIGQTVEAFFNKKKYNAVIIQCGNFTRLISKLTKLNLYRYYILFVLILGNKVNLEHELGILLQQQKKAGSKSQV